MRRIGLCTLITLTPSLLFSQVAPINPTFEVASVKRSAAKGGGGGITPEPNGLTATNVTLLFFIRIAYGVRDDQVSGPNWLNDERYDIVARTAAPATQDQLRLMLQTLLTERFKLMLHREERTQSGYALILGKDGPKLTESKSDGPGVTSEEGGHLAFRAASMSALARRLSQQLHEPVSDLTGLKGVYDFTLDWRQDDGVPAVPLTSALQEQLGLKLESRKIPIEILVIDHAEKVPTVN